MFSIIENFVGNVLIKVRIENTVFYSSRAVTQYKLEYINRYLDKFIGI